MQKTIFAIEPETGTGIAIVFEAAVEVDLKAAVKAAVQEFIQTEAGQKVYQQNCEAFNWGDLVNELPEELCVKHGFYISQSLTADEIVDLNEQLAELSV